VAVLDTGPGIVTTARRKSPQAMSMTDEQLLASLFDKATVAERGRGLGLPAVARAIRESEGAQLRAHTGTLRFTLAEQVKCRADGFPLSGTLVVATLPIERPSAGYAV